MMHWGDALRALRVRWGDAFEGVEGALRGCIWGCWAHLKSCQGDGSRTLLKALLRVFEGTLEGTFKGALGGCLRWVSGIIDSSKMIKATMKESLNVSSIPSCCLIGPPNCLFRQYDITFPGFSGMSNFFFLSAGPPPLPDPLSESLVLPPPCQVPKWET